MYVFFWCWKLRSNMWIAFRFRPVKRLVGIFQISRNIQKRKDNRWWRHFQRAPRCCFVAPSPKKRKRKLQMAKKVKRAKAKGKRRRDPPPLCGWRTGLFGSDLDGEPPDTWSKSTDRWRTCCWPWTTTSQASNQAYRRWSFKGPESPTIRPWWRTGCQGCQGWSCEWVTWGTGNTFFWSLVMSGILCDLLWSIFMYSDIFWWYECELGEVFVSNEATPNPQRAFLSASEVFLRPCHALEECNDSQSKALLAAGSRPGTGQKGDRFHLGSIQKKSVRMLHPNGNVHIDTLELGQVNMQETVDFRAVTSKGVQHKAMYFCRI